MFEEINIDLQEELPSLWNRSEFIYCLAFTDLLCV